MDFSIATNSPAVAASSEHSAEFAERIVGTASRHRRRRATHGRRERATSASPRPRFFRPSASTDLPVFNPLTPAPGLTGRAGFGPSGPSVQLPLFTGGLNRAKLAAARAAYDEAVAEYRQTVLGAFCEVEDELSAQHLLAEKWNSENEAVLAARRTLEIANNRYRAGLVTYLDVATAQTEALNQERSAVQLQGARLTAAVNLIEALGCGWQQTGK